MKKKEKHTRGSRLEPLLLPFITGGVVGVKQTDANDTSRLGPVSVISHPVHRLGVVQCSSSILECRASALVCWSLAVGDWCWTLGSAMAVVGCRGLRGVAVVVL